MKPVTAALQRLTGSQVIAAEQEPLVRYYIIKGLIIFTKYRYNTKTLPAEKPTLKSKKMV